MVNTRNLFKDFLDKELNNVPKSSLAGQPTTMTVLELFGSKVVFGMIERDCYPILMMIGANIEPNICIRSIFIQMSLFTCRNGSSI